jgi:nucleoside phosphorylase
MTLAGRFVLLAGSAGPEASPEQLSEAAGYVRDVVGVIVRAGGGVVVFTGAPEPRSESGHVLIFDWVALEEVDRNGVPGTLAAIAVTSAKVRGRMSAERAALLDRLVATGIIRLVMIADDIHTGGNIGDAQVAESSAMIAVGGGRGVVDRATKMMRKGAIVVPVDASIGAASADGKGSEGLHQAALKHPERFVPFATQALRDALPVLAVHGAVPDVAVNATVTVLARALSEQDAARPPEALVLTALPVELEAAKQALGITSEPRKTTTGTNVWNVDVTSRPSARSLRVAVACLGAAGNVSAATMATELTSSLHPRLVVMVGIAAGMRGKCLIGDVVLSERVTAYESAAIVAHGGVCGWLRRSLGLRATRLEPRPEMYRLAHAIEQDVTAYLAPMDALTSRLAVSLSALGVSAPTGDDIASKVQPRLATIASGEKLLRDPSVLAGLRGELHGRIELGEMEAAGIAEACRRLRTDFLIVRGVSDFGDKKKADNAHRLASAGAAVVCADFLREGLAFPDAARSRS